jgi:hypothetical protein
MTKGITVYITSQADSPYASCNSTSRLISPVTSSYVTSEAYFAFN